MGPYPSLSKIGNEELCRPFSEPEIRYTLFQMEKNKATGLDNFSIEFYQACWDFVKVDILQLFNDFYNENTNISQLWHHYSPAQSE